MDLGDFGFWILDFGDFGFWILVILGILDFGSWGFWILDFGAEIQNPKSPNPKSKIQTFLADFGDFGFWILDRYVAHLYVAPNFGDFGFWILGILDFGFWIWGILDSGFGDFGFWILDLGDFGFWGFWILGILDFGFWGFWILDFGPLCNKSLCEAPNAPNLGEFGFWILAILGILGILDFGFWGFWILDFGDFGFWILEFGDFGFWVLDFVTNFGFYIRRRRLCTPIRVGGLIETPRFPAKFPENLQNVSGREANSQNFGPRMRRIRILGSLGDGYSKKKRREETTNWEVLFGSLVICFLSLHL